MLERASPPRTTPAGTPVEVTETDHPTVACDGGDGPLGHPLVYLNLVPAGAIDCPYCGRHFIFKGDPAAGHGH